MTCAHTGKYSCYARNIINEEESTSKDIDVFVMCSPRPASNMLSELNFTTTLHSTVILSFTVISNPEPQPSDYVWKKCDVEESIGHLQCFSLVDEGHLNVSIVDLTSNLTISDFIQHDIGRYVLTVQNGVCDAWNQTFLVVIKDKPEAPLLFYESTALHSVILTTTAGYSGGISQSIILLYKNIHASEWIKVDAISDVPTNYTFSCTLTGLDSNINYTAITYASNELGNSTTVSIYFTPAVLEKSSARSVSTLNADVLLPLIGAGCGALMFLATTVLVCVCRKRKMRENSVANKRNVSLLVCKRRTRNEDQMYITAVGVLEHEPPTASQGNCQVGQSDTSSVSNAVHKFSTFKVLQDSSEVETVVGKEDKHYAEIIDLLVAPTTTPNSF
ncbi:uncharacterized protein LOC127861641 [Dreissena polymorpha]|uniref:uncharacterized protein LOC127861641 n=1 Tax=Dreissena polymorpha TaxID=45954 RepID=UPI00226457E7|nr:uncharacterized protein LOC127861641 [Dreissena polymorpha]